MKERVFFIFMGIATILWVMCLIALPFSATLYFISNL